MNYFQLQYMKLIRLSLVAETTLKIKDYNFNFKYKNFWINRALHYERKIISAWLSLLIFSIVWSLSNFAHRQYGAAPQSHFYS